MTTCKRILEYTYRSIGTPPCRHKLSRLFLVCITALSAVLYTAVAVCLSSCQEPTVQLYRQEKGVSIDDDGGGGA